MAEPERWKELEQLLDQALDLAPEERLGFLDRACSGDLGLRAEVERLLAASEGAASFLEEPGPAYAAPLVARLVQSEALGPGARLDAYEIVRELGRGGMATIHLAQDPKHHRLVAIKVLHSELAHTIGPDRFLREIEVIARLQHPHILPLLDSGQAEGRLYYVMPYVEGESLRHRLSREKQLPVESALRIVREAAEALGYAHRHGIIHRDIKPENILLADSQAVVADFGIARAIHAAGGESLTETGLALGTPAYMSPEQASGESDIDPRTDIYALGCVLYEMLAGEPPYTGPSAQAIMAKRLSAPVPHVRTLRETVPQHVENAITRSLARARADRFDTAEEFVEALAGGVAAPVKGWKRRAAVLGLGGVLVVGGLWAVLHPSPTPLAAAANTVAVLPFRVADPTLNLWREGMVDLLSINLDGAAGLRTIHPRTVLSRWHREVGDETRTDQTTTLGIAQRSGARYALTGSIVGSGKDLRVSAELYEVTSGSVEGRAQVEGPSDSIPALVDRLSLDLLRSGSVGAMVGLGALDIRGATTHSIEALKSYLAGEQKFRRARAAEAIEDFMRATEADSTFALAFYRLSLAESWSESPHLLSQGGNAAQTAARFTNRLRPREALLVRGLVQLNPGFLEALQILRSATSQYPQDAESWFLLGDALFHLGGAALEPREKFRQALHRAIELDPDFAPAYLHLAQDAFDRGDSAAVAEIVAALRRIDPATPNATGTWLAYALSWGDASVRREARGALDTASTSALLTAKHATGFTPDLWETTIEVAQALARQTRHAASRRAEGEGGTAFVYATHGRMREARAAWTRAYALEGLSPAAAQTRLARSELVAALGGSPDSSVGRRAYELLKNGPDSLAWEDHMGMYAARIGDWGEVERWMRRADFRSRELEARGDTLLARGSRAVVRLLRTIGRGKGGNLRRTLDESEALVRIFPNIWLGGTADLLHVDAARLLSAAGNPRGAQRYLESIDNFHNPMLAAVGEYLSGQASEAVGEREQARYHYARMVRWWKDADPELKPLWEEGRRALARVSGKP